MLENFVPCPCLWANIGTVLMKNFYRTKGPTFYFLFYFISNRGNSRKETQGAEGSRGESVTSWFLLSLRNTEAFSDTVQFTGEESVKLPWKKWRWSPFRAESHLCNFVQTPAPHKSLDQGLAQVPACTLRQHSNYQQLYLLISWSPRAVSPSQWMLVSCTLANTIPVFCLAVNGRLCPSVV